MLLYDASHEHNAGSKEHFFHFFWGYLLPAMREILRINEETDSDNTFILESCGPVMDPIMAEASRLLDVKIEFSKGSNSDVYKTILLLRWDRILRLCTDWFLNQYGHFDHFTGDNIIPEHILPEGEKYIEDILFVRQVFLRKLSHINAEKTGQFYLIRRSDEPLYYKEGGGATRLTYGTSRRALKNVDQAVDKLRSLGYRISTFEPGDNSLSDQIRTFNQASGIAAIRGAEFAHLIWMEPGTTVVMIEPPNMSGNAIQPFMAKILGLKFKVLKIMEETNYPELAPEMLMPYLSFR